MVYQKYWLVRDAIATISKEPDHSTIPQHLELLANLGSNVVVVRVQSRQLCLEPGIKSLKSEFSVAGFSLDGFDAIESLRSPTCGGAGV